ncbi:MAG TPA: type II secretion system ATPase GspE [Kofleriaceae bacterium]|jgi:general secretion pathway protein E
MVAAFPPSPHRAPRLGELLVQRCGIAQDAVDRALAKQVDEGGLIGEILVRMKLIDDDQLALALSLQSEIPYLRDLPRAEDIPVELIEKLPINFARQRAVLPLGRDGAGRVLVAIADPSAVDVIDAVAVLLAEPVEPVIASGPRISDHINKTYTRLRGTHELEESHKKGDDDGESAEEFQSEELVDMLDANDEAPIIRWVNSLMFQAARDGASDIHIRPGEKDIIVRYRVDGLLREAKRAPKKFQQSIVARVKIMAGLNIAEKRLPQDGRIRRKMAGKDVDMRVATSPTAAGESITIRLLDRSSVLLGLADIGFGTDHLETIRGIIARPHGILLVTGPTGSGKTTTLYACISEINSPDINILTVEDPVEYQLEGISQTQVNSKIDLTFASGLRSFLRQDPDVIMVGEIRDRETAEVAITASLTGHLVFSTVHTNDAAGGVARLIDMGIEPFLVASSLVGLLAQRLVRRPCKECARPVRPSEEIVRELGLDPQVFFSGGYHATLPQVKGQRQVPVGHVLEAVGCHACNQLGYKGRTGIYELLVVSDAVRRLTLEKADAGSIRNVAVEAGMVTLRLDGARKCMLGLTTPEEVMLMTAESGD